MFFPKQVYLWGSILEKKRLDTLVGALCCVGRGFGCAGRAGLGWAWDLAVLGALGWVGRGVWLWWGLGADLAFCVWFVFVFICMSISDVYHGAWAKQSLALVNETWFWAIPCSKSVMWSERNGSKRREAAVAATNTASKGQHRQQCSPPTTTLQFQHNNTSWKMNCEFAMQNRDRWLCRRNWTEKETKRKLVVSAIWFNSFTCTVWGLCWCHFSCEISITSTQSWVKVKNVWKHHLLGCPRNLVG